MLHFPEETFIDRELDADQRAVAANTLRELQMGVNVLAQTFRDQGLLPAQLTKSVLSVAEHRIADLGRLAGVSTNSEADIAARSASLREANLRIQELESQVGAQTGAATLAEALSHYAQRVEDWWEREGLGYVRSFSFGRHGQLELELSCTPTGGFLLSSHSETPITDAQEKALWLRTLAERGFVLLEGTTLDDCAVKDCDASRECLLALLTRALPSASVTEFRQLRHRKGGFALRSVKLYVRKLTDLDSLQAPAAEQPSA